MWYPEIEMVFHRGTESRQNSKMSVAIFIDGAGGKVYVPRAMNSFRMSFWTVPDNPLHAKPRRRAAARYRARRIAAVELIVIDTETRSRGSASVRISMSSRVAIATPTLPTSPRAAAASESNPICVGRSKATERPVCPRSRRYR
jgi:hypothetical protein